MSLVNSVLGPLDSDKLGYTLMHEHLHGAGAAIFQNYPELLDHNIKDHVVAGLRRAKKAGIDTIVDASTLDVGRDIALMIRASQESGINIIATTGWCLNPDNFIGEMTADQFAQLFVRDIKDGIAGTGARAGLIKSGADKNGVTQGGEIMLRAAARAHLQTGTPIFLHSFAPGEIGRQQLA
ncbi:MAG: phosphotriesterase-related protein, partial [Dehalococcoidia bacterium]